jgi:hypothetical protein
VRTMVGEVAAQKALSDETIAAVLERTGGVPLFVEELTRAVLEGGDAKLTEREIQSCHPRTGGLCRGPKRSSDVPNHWTPRQA